MHVQRFPYVETHKTWRIFYKLFRFESFANDFVRETEKQINDLPIQNGNMPNSMPIKQFYFPFCVILHSMTSAGSKVFLGKKVEIELFFVWAHNERVLWWTKNAFAAIVCSPTVDRFQFVAQKLEWFMSSLKECALVASISRSEIKRNAFLLVDVNSSMNFQRKN